MESDNGNNMRVVTYCVDGIDYVASKPHLFPANKVLGRVERWHGFEPVEPKDGNSILRLKPLRDYSGGRYIECSPINKQQKKTILDEINGKRS